VTFFFGFSGWFFPYLWSREILIHNPSIAKQSGIINNREYRRFGSCQPFKDSTHRLFVLRNTIRTERFWSPSLHCEKGQKIFFPLPLSLYWKTLFNSLLLAKRSVYGHTPYSAGGATHLLLHLRWDSSIVSTSTKWEERLHPNSPSACERKLRGKVKRALISPCQISSFCPISVFPWEEILMRIPSTGLNEQWGRRLED